jgi:hypothetical protein
MIRINPYQVTPNPACYVPLSSLGPHDLAFEAEELVEALEALSGDPVGPGTRQD